VVRITTVPPTGARDVTVPVPDVHVPPVALAAASVSDAIPGTVAGVTVRRAVVVTLGDALDH
jgi:hypothetical protein